MKFILALVTLISAASQALGASLYEEENQNDEPCVDLRDRCPLYAEKEDGHYCDNNKDFMVQYCPRSCGFCQPAPTFVPEKCKDKIPGCARQAANKNYCAENKEFMEAFCAKSCGYCGTRQPIEPKETKFSWDTRRWGECKDGMQERDVLCYLKCEKKFYQVLTGYCEKELVAKPAKRRACV